jgi:hypothetical protein
VLRFDELLGGAYYAFRRGASAELAARLGEGLPLRLSLFSDYAFLPWIARLELLYDVELPATLRSWLEELARRPAVAAELELIRGLR